MLSFFLKLLVWSSSGDTRGPPLIFEAVDAPCQGPLHFPHISDYVYDLCPLPDPDVGPSVLVSVCDVEHSVLISILVSDAAQTMIMIRPLKHRKATASSVASLESL